MPLLKGAPQCAIISSLLYSLYVINCSVIYTKIIQYADDFNKLSKTLSIVGTNISKYMIEHDLVISINKTEVMFLKKKKREQLILCSRQSRLLRQLNFWVYTCPLTEYLIFTFTTASYQIFTVSFQHFITFLAT